ncbi:outer membrane protein [Rhodoligotrophos defluvii]|uniref:outer membrane protein n=1 Tax=Rhodoligotrophos defluvii TaxID=2561934 RepID=UPI0014859792|nr:outer membrane beta-barrel protein [Rhodoligotrophos defluvii]
MTSQALAADLPPSPPPVSSYETVHAVSQPSPLPWQGFHVGVLGGFTKSKANVNAFRGPEEARVEGPMLGGLAGFDMQLGNMVLGAEADTSFGSVKGAGLGTTVELRQFSTFRGRVGYALGDVLLYGTAGLALADVAMKSRVCQTCIKADDLVKGWTYGGGIETKLTDNVSLRGEYLYTDLDAKQFDFNMPKGSGRLRTDGMHTFRAAVSYQLPIF